MSSVCPRTDRGCVLAALAEASFGASRVRELHGAAKLVVPRDNFRIAIAETGAAATAASSMKSHSINPATASGRLAISDRASSSVLTFKRKTGALSVLTTTDQSCRRGTFLGCRGLHVASRPCAAGCVRGASSHPIANILVVGTAGKPPTLGLSGVEA